MLYVGVDRTMSYKVGLHLSLPRMGDLKLDQTVHEPLHQHQACRHYLLYPTLRQWSSLWCSVWRLRVV